jgi:hypothetical protein
VKETVPGGRMLRLLYARDRANEAMNRARKEKPDVGTEDVFVNLTLKDKARTGQLVRSTVAEIQKQLLGLEALAKNCDGCRASVDGRPYGCRGKIAFPISFKAEAFLMSLIHGKAGEPTPQLLTNYFDSNGITGNPVAEMRQKPGIFFESQKALVRRYDDGTRIGVNKVLELLFMTGQISAKHARFLLGLLDLYEKDLPVDRDLNSLPNLFVVEKEEDGMVVSRVGLRLKEDGEDDGSIREMQNFFGALLIASELGCDVWVKY